MPSQVNGLVLRHLPARVVDPLMRVSQRLQVGDLSEHGLPPSPRGAYTKFLEDDVVPILDVGFASAVKKGQVEVVAGVDGFDGAEVVLMDGSRIAPDAVIACTGYRRALDPLVGHLGVLGKKGRPVVHGPRTHPAAPGLHFIGYTNPISGMFREIAIDARRIGRAVAATSSAP
jgi:putative flavoprotein involved in K+ transport